MILGKVAEMEVVRSEVTGGIDIELSVEIGLDVDDCALPSKTIVFNSRLCFEINWSIRLDWSR